MSAARIVDDYVSALPAVTRRLAPAQWGLTVESEAVAGEPLDIGLRIADGMLRAQAFVIARDRALDPWMLLHWNRKTRLVRFGCAAGGDLWIHGDLPVAALEERSIDRLLGLVVEAAAVARRYAAAARAA
jgi:hypothetical protein